MYSITATIGRNFTSMLHEGRQVPMGAEVWARMQSDTLEQMSYLSQEAHRLYGEPGTIEIHRGQGQWTDAYGITVSEESLKVTVLLDSEPHADDYSYIRTQLGIIANQYNQDAIALTIGRSELIRSLGDAEITATAEFDRRSEFVD